MKDHPACSGSLSPWANPVSSALGWQALTRTRCLASAMTGDAGTVRSHGDGEWRTLIPEPTLIVTVTDADDSALWCRPVNLAGNCALIVIFAPWTPATVLKCPVTALPAHGTLTVRDVRMKTRMGRTRPLSRPPIHNASPHRAQRTRQRVAPSINAKMKYQAPGYLGA